MSHPYEKRSLGLEIFRVMAAVLLFISIFYIISPGADKIKVYFYSSETNINNFKSLKMEFDRYLSRFGPYEFQPFSNREDFEAHIKDKQNCLLLLSSWHYRRLYKAYALTPVFTGLRKGEKYQKRILIGAGTAADIASVQTARIASASEPGYTINALMEMLPEQYSGDRFRILTVPKDIDALMSVGFGMATFALSTGYNFEDLKTANPRMCARMQVLAEGKPSLFLVLAMPSGFNEDSKKMVEIMNRMSLDPEGLRNIRMLGLDGWQPIEPKDRQKLES